MRNLSNPVDYKVVDSGPGDRMLRAGRRVFKARKLQESRECRRMWLESYIKKHWSALKREHFEWGLAFIQRRE